MQLNFDRREQLKHIFSTPLGMFMVPNARDLMPRIARVILDRETKEGGVERRGILRDT